MRRVVHVSLPDMNKVRGGFAIVMLVSAFITAVGAIAMLVTMAVAAWQHVPLTWLTPLVQLFVAGLETVCGAMLAMHTDWEATDCSSRDSR